MIVAALLLAAQTLHGGPVGEAAPAPAAASAAPAPFQHVVVISVDGLRPDAIDLTPGNTTPALAQMTRGPHTLNARADSDMTITLPNHLSMFTGRFAAGEGGHGWVENNEPPAARHGGTLQKRSGHYSASMFDVAHDHGLTTGVFASKGKFWILEQSYSETEGAPDKVPPDNGKGKLDVFTFAPQSWRLAQQACAWLQTEHGRSLTFVHFSDPDSVGHANGWDMQPDSDYLKAVQRADKAVGLILSTIEKCSALRAHTAVILTSDHGGGVPFKTHTEPDEPVNFRIPFLLWLGTDTPSVDLNAINSDTRAVPRVDEHVARDAAKQPIRNADVGNLALSLLGLPAIEGSQVNAQQDLRWTAAAAAPMVAPAAPKAAPPAETAK